MLISIMCHSQKKHLQCAAYLALTIQLSTNLTTYSVIGQQNIDGKQNILLIRVCNHLLVDIAN